jgi:hypothetical protein
MREPTAETFLRDVAEHQMQVKLNNGIYRHIHFARTNNEWNMWFDLVTWPGFLTISGDMGTWTFARLEDMFTFFRSSKGLHVNPSYWAEKLQNGNNNGRNNAKVYEEEMFKSQLLAQIGGYYGLEGKELEEVTQAVIEEVLVHDCKYDLMIAARDFTHTLSTGRKFQFSCEMPDGRDYSYHFIWCLYAIVWGIKQWDAENARRAA